MSKNIFKTTWKILLLFLWWIVAIYGVYFLYIISTLFTVSKSINPHIYYKRHSELFKNIEDNIKARNEQKNTLDATYVYSRHINGQSYYSIIIWAFLENSQEIVYSVDWLPPPNQICWWQILDQVFRIQWNRYYIYCT